MSKGTIADAVQAGRVLVSDGAWGTLLQAKGLQPGECPELWCLERPAEVLDIARGYVAAGADMIETNSFGANRLKLGLYGLAGRAAEINEAAARLSREAAGEGVWVIASVGPTGKLLAAGDVTEEELYEAFREQCAALERGGADGLCIETMMAADEAAIAVRAARESTRCEVLCTFTFQKTARGDHRTLMGTTPAEAAQSVLAAGADVVGTNCGNGLEGMIPIVRELRQAAPQSPILVQANAGLPRSVDGKDVFPETPAMMAAHVGAVVAAGANILGGCCGTTPEHIRAIRQAVARLPRP